jgi:hypothetical protein
MSCRRILAVLALSFIAAVPGPAAVAQGPDLSAARPGRDPKQPIDEEYTKKIREYTTEKFFGSPLVDYLPASKTVPTPKVVLGDIAGAPGKLPYSKEVYDYMRRLDAASPRVKVLSIGTTEEGREMIAVAVAAERLMNAYEANRAKLAKLADPRMINMDDAEAHRIMADVAPVYYITGTIHSTEAGAPTALMELAYRLAVDESAYIRNIRENVITLITPIVEVDGRDRIVDLYNYSKKYPDNPVPNALYWGHYVAHDNNRDAMGVTLKLTENVLNTYVDQKALVLHDLHESVAYLYDNTIGDGPYNAWIDPLLANEWQQIGWHNVQEMTRFGMPGVFAHGTFDTWSPGYLMFIAALHNGVSRLYETFGNGGSADTRERTLGANDTQRTWYRQNPALPRAMWSLRNNNNYEQTGLLVSLAYVANNKTQTLQNFYERSKRSVLKARTEGPAAWVLSANEPSLGRQADLLKVLQKQRVEVSRATAPFTVTLPVRRPTTIAANNTNATNASGDGNGRAGAGGAGAAGAGAGDAAVGGGGAGGRGGRGGRGNNAPATETRQFPAGSYIIRMDQPYSRIADALLDYQYWAPNDPQTRPYDDTGWTFPEGFAVEAVRVTDTKVLDVPVSRVSGEIRAPGGVTGTGSVFAINANADNQLVTLRYALKSADFQAAEEAFDAAGQKFNRGSFVIRGVPAATLDSATKSLGLKAHAMAAAPSVKMHPVRAPRVAIMHSWTNTQTEGWWRIAFDQAKVPYDYISVQDIAKTPNLQSRWDVIIFPPGTGNERQMIDGTGNQWGKPVPWKQSPDMPNIGTLAQSDDIRQGMGLEGMIAVRDFLRNGGLIIAATSGASFTMSQGFASGITESTPSRRQVVGTLLRSRMVDAASPIAYGVNDHLAVFTDNGASYTVGGAGGRGGRGGGGAAAPAPAGGRGPTRATGRGRPDETDAVQGFAIYTPRVRADTADTAATGAGRGGNTPPPPEMRPRPILRFSEQPDLLVSGLLDGGEDIAGRTNLVDAPIGKGHVVIFSFNPMWRGETAGSYPFVFNALMHFDNLGVGRR